MVHHTAGSGHGFTPNVSWTMPQASYCVCSCRWSDCGFCAVHASCACRVAKQSDAPVWLPVADIQHDAEQTDVPMYRCPFAHEQLLQRLRGPRHSSEANASSVIPSRQQPQMWRNFVHLRDEDGMLHALRPQMLLTHGEQLAQQTCVAPGT
jgi:hypothetical protein